jgi:S-(hydroxymethyl)glutathione dehydrogenase / alcohol dehydrogenase
VFAAVLHSSPGDLSVEEVTVGEPGPFEVLIRVAAAGLCHSDLHHLERETGIPVPSVLGHEGAGVVEAVGSNVTYVAPGDHVVTFATTSCGKCEWCLCGSPNLCPAPGTDRAADQPPRLRLSDGRPCSQHGGLGTFAEYMLVHENALVNIRRSIPLECAALLGCGVATGVGAVIRTAQVPVGATVAVVGCGGIGLSCIQGALIAGASRIIGIDIRDGKLDLARQFGATDVINNSEGDAREQLEALLPGKGGVDYSFEAIGIKETFELAFSLLRPRGTATMLGVGIGTFEVPARPLQMGELKVQGSLMGSLRFRQDVPMLLGLYEDGRLKLDEMVSNRISLDQINEGYAAITMDNVARSVLVFD